jgi:hypothetical protein
MAKSTNLPVAAAIVAVLLMFGAAGARADQIEVMLGNEFGEVNYTRDADFVGLDQGRAAAGLLLTEDNTVVGYGGVEFPVLEETTDIDFSVGARLYLAGLVEPGDDVIGIGFGASARYKLPLGGVPFLRRFPLWIASSIYFAPEVTTSGAGIDILDVHIIRGELELGPNVYGLAGLRTLNVDRDDGDNDIVDERFYLGVRVQF